jgi:2-dehydropantoate 2-reductase
MTSLDRLKVGVIGLGPVGSILALHLKAGGMEVFGCDIDQDKVQAIRKKGIQLTGAIEHHSAPTSVTTSIPDLMKMGLDLVAIAVKAPYLASVIKVLREQEGSFYVASIQNGIDNELELAEVFGRDRTLRMVVNYAGYSLGQTEVRVTFFNPPNYLASLGSKGKDLAKMVAASLTAAGLETRVPKDLRHYIWEKAILNASLSPVCAVTGKTMKAVMEIPEGRSLVEGIIQEALQVADAEGINFPAHFVRHCLHYLDQGGDHRPSMLVDLDTKHPTEINVLNGKLVEYGRRHGIPTPYNQMITTLVKLLEQDTVKGVKGRD